MARKKDPRTGLTEQQETFCQEYVKNPVMYQAYVKAYPKALNWKRSSVDPEASRLLDNPKINTRISEIMNAQESALLRSTTLNKRKLLETALQTMIECNTPAERQHFVSLIKMLFQKEGMLSPESVTQVNIQNNTTVNEVTGYLDL
jgi:hypothetical protein